MPERRESILVADDDPEMRSFLEDVLVAAGYDVVTAENGAEALDRVRADGPSLVLLDLEMPKVSGMEVLTRLAGQSPPAPVIVLTAHVDVSHVVEAMRLGAADYVTKPFAEDELLVRIRNLLERQTLRSEVATLRVEVAAVGLREHMGPSAVVVRLAEQIALVAASNFSVIIEGETGSGKEVVARAIHRQSPRRDHRFVALDCGALSETLIESELFGYERGAFTGADRKKKGYVQLAEGGTLFLDEIANVPALMQMKLLRAVQEREILPVGGQQPVAVDVRIIAASNVSLEGEVRAGRFRQDLYYRLNEFTVRVPPLRERREDIVHLARRFLDEVGMELRQPARELSPEAAEALTAHAWPGNARELRNVVRRAALLASGPILPEHLDVLAVDPESPSRPGRPPTVRLGQSLRAIAEAAAEHAEREAIRQALEAARGNKSEAARLLGTEYKTLHLKMRRYGIPARDRDDA